MISALFFSGCVEKPIGGDTDAHGCLIAAGYNWCDAKQKCLRASEEDCNVGQMVGNDRDEHGCIGSAGYSWCEAKQKCLRVWEEACADDSAITNYSECIAAGYPAIKTLPQQCETSDGKNFVEESSGPQCVTLDDCPPGAARCVDGKCTSEDEHGCVPDGGYTWCEAKQKCLRVWEEACDENAQSSLTYEEARQIALDSNCTAEGPLAENHFYNENSRTWWIDLNVTKEGCAPACVVSEDTNTAEINWRCTGALLP